MSSRKRENRVVVSRGTEYQIVTMKEPHHKTTKTHLPQSKDTLQRLTIARPCIILISQDMSERHQLVSSLPCHQRIVFTLPISNKFISMLRYLEKNQSVVMTYAFKSDIQYQ